jgi:hypothetical protein
MEPVGYFVSTGNAWDYVATVASIGALAVFLAGYFASRVNFKQCFEALNYFDRASLWLWFAGIFAVVVVIIINEKLNISHVPVSPRKLDIPWPLQGLFNWFLATGALIFLFVPLYFDALKGRIVKSIFLFIAVCVAISVSLYSRGIVVYGSLILLSGIFVYGKFLPAINKITLAKIFLIIVIGTIFSIILSQERREDFNERRQQGVVVNSEVSSNRFISDHSLFLILKLPLERWVGLEGIMAVSAYPGKGAQLLYTAIQERRTVGPVDMYTNKIALSPTTDTEVAMYATPPGIIAFFLYADNLIIVFAGVFLFTLCMIFAEYLVMHFSGNLFLASAIGTAGAMQLIHTGSGGLLVPAQMFATTLAFCILIGSLSRKLLAR